MQAMRFVTFSVCVYTLMAGIVGQAGPDAHGHSRVFVVNDVSSLHDANPGDGVCDVGSGNCTLRAAIEEANQSPGRNTVVVPAGTYAAAGVHVSADLTVKGAGETDTVISCAVGGAPPAFLIDPSVKVEIRGVTITNCGTAFFGGGIYNDGGDLTITNSKITACASLEGGGIRSVHDGNVTIMHSEISQNAADAAGGIEIVGGNLTISHSQIVHNHAQSFAGIYNLGATATIVHSEISENHGLGIGGIYNSGTMTMKQSNVTGNTASPGACPGIKNTGVLTIIASEIIGNTYFSPAPLPGADLCNEGTLELKATTVGDCRGCN